MEYKELLQKLGFGLKNNAVDIYIKNYNQASGYVIEVDIDKEKINYGDKVRFDNKNTQNFSQPENFVVLECVNRLLEKGYRPENIILEKTYPLGHKDSGRLDILVEKDTRAYLMIECKTYGKEFDKALKELENYGGQLFTYFQQDKNAELLMLYASDLQGNSEARIIEIKDEQREAGNVQEAFNFWNGQFYEKGFWEQPPYNFTPKRFTKKDLRELTESEGLSLFNKFATILRKHSVSDKPNAFNKIFNLFLAKLYDELKKDNEELEFHWREYDHPVDFQVRLFNLHVEGLLDFLRKTLSHIKPELFQNNKTRDEIRDKMRDVLMLNKIYDIKEVFDIDTFEENHRILKEVVELLQQYQIKYPRRQLYLGEFFERLLTTGLKQESGQFFTPPVVARFIIKSLPLTELIEKEINKKVPSLPATIDFAAGSGHFLTEVLEEYQDIIEKLDTSDFYDQAKGQVLAWKYSPYSWAAQYIYGIEKDYRLVKVAKVGCYFYGDGLAQVILGDGLDSFEKSKSYLGLLKDNVKGPQFSILVSNPPYSVDGIRDDIEYIGSKNEFTLFKNLTYNSSEIECLFVERAKHLLKDDGIAGIVLPSSILNNNSKIHIETREIILQCFDIVAIAQLGSNTFMATNTNTVVLFLRKRNMEKVNQLKKEAYQRVEDYLKTNEDKVINNIDRPIGKYLKYTEEKEIDPEKFYYFILNYHQKTVLIKTGNKEEEKIFLGYKIVKRRGQEGYHSIEANKNIEECTKLFDTQTLDNPEKASTYIYKAFRGDYNFPIHESLKNNVFRVFLIDMMIFNRKEFDKNISTVVKKKVKIESKYNIVKLGDVAQIAMGNSAPQDKMFFKNGTYPFVRTSDVGNVHLSSNLNIVKDYLNEKAIVKLKKFPKGTILFPKSGASTFLNHRAILGFDAYISSHLAGIIVNNEKVLTHYLYEILALIKAQDLKIQSDYPSLNENDLMNISVPLPPLSTQKNIVLEMEKIEKEENDAKKKVDKGREKIENKIKSESKYDIVKLGDVAEIAMGNSAPQDKMFFKNGTYPFVRTSDVGNVHLSSNLNVVKDYLNEKAIVKLKKFPKGTILFPKSGASTFLNHRAILGFDAYISSHLAGIIANNEKILTYYLYETLALIKAQDLKTQSDYPSLNENDLANIKIPLPPLSTQKKVVAEIEKIEAEISEAQKIIDDMPERKKEILKKYGIG